MFGKQGFITSLKVAMVFLPGVTQVDISTKGWLEPPCLYLCCTQCPSKVMDFPRSQHISPFFQFVLLSARKDLVKMESKPGKLRLI